MRTLILPIRRTLYQFPQGLVATAIEQAIGDVADHLAKAFEANNPGEAGTWVQATKELRFPYWDWAAPKVVDEGLPPVLMEDNLASGR